MLDFWEPGSTEPSQPNTWNSMHTSKGNVCITLSRDRTYAAIKIVNLKLSVTQFGKLQIKTEFLKMGAGSRAPK